MLSLLYTSRSLLPRHDSSAQLRAILEVATRRNACQNITGALVSTGTDFAQILEGPEEGVANVMASILIDSRHEDVHIVHRETISQRRFPAWGMSLVDPDPKIVEHVASIRAARSDDDLAEAVDAVIARMRLRYLPADA